MAGEVGKGVCTSIFGKSGVRSYFIKEDLGLRVKDGVRSDFQDVSLGMVRVLLWIQQSLPNLMEWGETVCGNINMIVCDKAAIVASSALHMVLVIPAPFGSANLPELGWYA